MMTPEQIAAVVKVRFTITKADARKLSRISRWEKASESTCLTLGPRAILKEQKP